MHEGTGETESGGETKTGRESEGERSLGAADGRPSSREDSIINDASTPSHPGIRSSQGDLPHLILGRLRCSSLTSETPLALALAHAARPPYIMNDARGRHQCPNFDRNSRRMSAEC